MRRQGLVFLQKGKKNFAKPTQQAQADYCAPVTQKYEQKANDKDTHASKSSSQCITHFNCNINCKTN